jgi:hypothetical protein
MKKWPSLGPLLPSYLAQAIASQNLRINGQVFTVVKDYCSQRWIWFQNQDDVVYIPLDSAKQVFGTSYLTSSPWLPWMKSNDASSE